ncbi:MAG TPA: DegT/DnrJ/EryC1/StrS family aminotransferase [Acidimicrobiia bacterium]|nr:DegT/DnrJ/EryC1/StrS family aminotransferase [Acidimicrobiia bacterium]
MDHRRAPILEALEAYHAADFASFCIPAHKQGRGLDADTRRILGAAPFRADVLMHKGLDDRTGSHGVLQAAQELAADAFGADQSFFSTNGSTLAVQAAVIAGARPGEKILVQRNAHKSAVAGAILSGAEVVWVDPDIDDDRRLGHGVVPGSLAAAFDDHPDARAALCISPSYYGVAADIAGLADVCHRHGVPLLMDDAWGADFHFHGELPAAAMDSGADLALGSFHKSLGGMLQSSIISVKGDLVDVERLQLILDSMETTSTSSLLLASIDGARRAMVLHGEELLGETLRIARRVSSELQAIGGLEVMGREVTDRPGAAGLDETKITVDLTGLGITGYDAADWLYDHRRVAVEGVDYRHLMFIVTIGDDQASGDRLVAAVGDLAAMARGLGRPPLAPMAFTEALFRGAEYPLRPRDAFLGPTRHAKLGDAAGEIAAEPVSPYPPGVPVVVPGQRITAEIVDFLQAGMEAGMYVEGASDPSLQVIRVAQASS